METYHKIQTLFKRDLDGSRTGQKGKMIEGEWTTDELAYLAGNEWEFTEKVDGTNIRIRWDSGEAWLEGRKGPEFGGRSDNAVIPEPLKRYLEATFTADRFINADLDDITLFGEGYGPKIQNGGLYRDDVSFVLFDVKIGPWWLTRDNVNDIAKKLGIDSVPVVGYGTLYDGIKMVSNIEPSWPDRPEFMGGPMRSTWGDFIAEGIVARPVVPMFNRKGERIITKIKAVDFR